MQRAIFAAILSFSLLCLGQADAQQVPVPDAQIVVPEPSVIITMEPPDQAASSYGFASSKLEDATEGIRRTRIALISTSAAAGVGIVLLGVAASQCQFVETVPRSRYDSDDLLCNRAGDALLAAGGTIFGLAAIGMITSGIMLGVRKGKRRRLEREMRSLQYGKRLQWDVPSGGLVF